MVSDELKRAGELKGELIRFACSRFPKLYNDQVLEEFKRGPERIIILEEDTAELDNPTDRFVLETRLPDGRTIVEVFVAERTDLPEQEREMILGWQDVSEGIFQIDRRLPDGFILYNLLNDLVYEAKPNKEIDPSPFGVGGFIYARLIPVDEQTYMFSGAAISFGEKRKLVVKLVEDLLMDNPARGYEGNPAKVGQGFALLNDQYRTFGEHFGGDELISSGRKLTKPYREFMHLISGEGGPPLPTDLPKDLVETDDVGFLCDEVEGISFLQGYGEFRQIFEDPSFDKRGKLAVAQAEVIRGYLKSDTISTVSLRKMASSFPDHAQKVFRAALGRPYFDLARDFDALMMEFKPGYVKAREYPSIIMMGDRIVKLRNEAEDEGGKGEKKSEKKKTGRNDPCSCGSGKKRKHCCGREG